MLCLLAIQCVKSSPRTWGCFRVSGKKGCFLRVFPTHVGVFLFSRAMDSIPERLPHARGGVSGLLLRRKIVIKSSPRTWGCFFFSALPVMSQSVFPTHVGGVPSSTVITPVRRSLPHSRGAAPSPFPTPWRALPPFAEHSGVCDSAGLPRPPNAHSNHPPFPAASMARRRTATRPGRLLQQGPSSSVMPASESLHSSTQPWTEMPVALSPLLPPCYLSPVDRLGRTGHSSGEQA